IGRSTLQRFDHSILWALGHHAKSIPNRFGSLMMAGINGNYERRLRGVHDGSQFRFRIDLNLMRNWHFASRCMVHACVDMLYQRRISFIAVAGDWSSGIRTGSPPTSSTARSYWGNERSAYSGSPECGMGMAMRGGM